MFIGEAAKQTGLTIKAIRFYEAKGLIPSPSRQGRYRVYNQDHLDLLILIKEAKGLGIPLSRLEGVIEITQGQINWPVIAQFLAQAKNEILQEIAHLQLKVTQIDQCIEQIHG